MDKRTEETMEAIQADAQEMMVRRIKAQGASRGLEREVKVIEQGDGLSDVVDGAELWDSESDELVVVLSVGSQIYTDHPQGNYVIARVERAERDVTSLSDEEFAGLPAVRVRSGVVEPPPGPELVAFSDSRGRIVEVTTAGEVLRSGGADPVANRMPEVLVAMDAAMAEGA